MIFAQQKWDFIQKCRPLRSIHPSILFFHKTIRFRLTDSGSLRWGRWWRDVFRNNRLSGVAVSVVVTIQLLTIYFPAFCVPCCTWKGKRERRGSTPCLWTLDRLIYDWTIQYVESTSAEGSLLHGLCPKPYEKGAIHTSITRFQYKTFIYLSLQCLDTFYIFSWPH